MKRDAKLLQDSGADIVLLECIPTALGQEITQELHVPVIGIGAGPYTDGQILVREHVRWALEKVISDQ